MFRWFLVIVSSLLLGAAFSYLNVPAAWIVASIIASGIMALSTKQELRVNEKFYSLGRGIIGVMAAVPIVGVPLGQLAHYILPGLVVSAVTIGIGFATGMVLSRFGVSRETGILSSLTGGASVMPVIAKELGADIRYVALAQYLRLLAVSMTLPLVASFLDAPGESHVAGIDVEWWMWFLVLAIAILGGPIARFLHIPVPSVFGPLLLTVLIAQFIPADIVAPEPLGIIAFLSIGWVCGGSLSVPALQRFSRLLPATITFIIVIMSACAAMGVVVSKWLNISYFEGYLATSPGALETVLALSAEGGAGPAVIAIQLIRLIAILLMAGYLPKILRRF
ncbi:AbrB family transcriptional regulator [Corynebacterium breve]|uniref:AbrB family transcriptional regulator n=1 Tax=Corynebacterium breve TaxID=3049799 RepID=A0ABY8VDW1_9CORY|nr:AbrB family transcriptional regulator [Corynebacterium breve]WIM67845.1 AbrB family transcriptional regulator [Corynebacterium breve]